MSSKGPNFIGIGMERAGTSWLFAQLASHPEIWVPPLKELHYFDVIDPRAKYLTHRYRYHFMSRLKQKLAPIMRMPHRPEFHKNSFLTYLRWDFDYFIGRFNLDWYVRLFHPRYTKGRVSGEITPAYSNLTPATIATILEMNPKVKFILMVRDPAARMWSGCVHHFRHIEGRHFDDVSAEEMLAFLKDSAARDRSDIESILETWRGRIPEGHLMVQQFERIAEEPEALIADIYDYLGVAGGYLPPEDLYKRKVNAYTQDGFSMPDEVRTFIETACAR